MIKLKDFEEMPIEYDDLKNEDNYHTFLRKVLKYADCICVTCDGLDYETFMESDWNFLQNSIIEYEYTDETAVTLGPDVMLLYLKIDHITAAWLKEKKHIYDFMTPQTDGKNYYWLYDLCLAKNGQLIFTSCSHEEFCYISKDVLDKIK